MEFQPLYYGDRVRIVNPAGDVGIVTLWSKVDSVCRVLEEAGVDFSSNSRIAVVANLFGNGLPHMLRNLLYNPQISYIMICGKNLSGSREWLVNFFKNGLEEIMFLGVAAYRIKGTDRVMDGEVHPEDFKKPPLIDVFGEIGDPQTAQMMSMHFLNIPPQKEGDLLRITPPPIPEPEITRFPSNPAAHLVVRRTPMEAWKELIFRLYRFGHRNQVAKKGGTEERIELLNTHVVIEKPNEESGEVLKAVGFSLEKFRAYGERILDPNKPSDLPYTYGNLLRHGVGAIPVDAVEIMAERLQKEPESRHAFATLWNNNPHLLSGNNCPCFVTLFFRKFEDKLTMTATFRAHNAMDGWPENVYGLIAIQRFVARKADMERGSITVISESISIDPGSLEKAKRIVEEKTTDQVFDPATEKFGPRMDAHGEFTVTYDVESQELVVEHSFGGMKLHEYRGKSAEDIELQLARDCALSVISHALYLGRELARKEIQMKAARPKTQ